MVERHVRDVEAVGSNPVTSTKYNAQGIALGVIFLTNDGIRRGAVVNDSPVDCQSRA